jgi:hypothetical protein
MAARYVPPPPTRFGPASVQRQVSAAAPAGRIHPPPAQPVQAKPVAMPPGGGPFVPPPPRPAAWGNAGKPADPKAAPRHMGHAAAPPAAAVQRKAAGPAFPPAGGVPHRPAVIQRAAAADLAAAQQNETYIANNVASLVTASGNVRTEIGNLPPGATKNEAAAGIRAFWESMVDQMDGRFLEMAEAERLAQKAGAKKRIPLMGQDVTTDPDISYTKAGGKVTAKELKAVNSGGVGAVNQRLKDADTQLGKRAADRRKVFLRIENTDNAWPRVAGYGGRTTNTALRDDIWAHAPTFDNADLVKVEGINTPMGIRNFVARVGGSGRIVKSSIQIF